VGRGYLNDPELTGEKFIANPFDKDPDSRLYRTGDLARALPDGNFEFLGRTDDQIKIRGYRIEPNEVCAVLCRHEAVQSGVIVPIKDATGSQYLAAYVVFKQEAHVTATDLRKHLQAYLPDYMVPNAFLSLDAFPLTTNGKVDRAALPIPDSTNSLKNGAVATEATPTEQELLPIVSALLKVDRINPNDNFFLLGGHSLLGAQLLAEIQRVFHVDLPLRTIFDYPTLTAISSEIDRVRDLVRQAEQYQSVDPDHGNKHGVESSAP
jgi:acyl carrier protein